jgi:hypothetical protein
VRIRDRIAQGIFVVGIVASLAMFAVLAKPVFELEPHTNLILRTAELERSVPDWWKVLQRQLL